MDKIPECDDSGYKSLTHRLLAVFEILLVSGIVSGFLTNLCLAVFINKTASKTLLNDLEILPFALLLAAGIDLLLIVTVLKIHRESIQRIGLHWNRWKSNIFTGLMVVPLLLFVNFTVVWIFQTYLPQYYMKENPLTENIKTIRQLGFFIIMAIIAGGIQEELQRAFILDRFDRYLGGAGVGLVLWSIAFGLSHYVQGAQGIVTAGIFSIIFGTLFLVRRSLLGPIVAHSIYNTLISLGYWFSR